MFGKVVLSVQSNLQRVELTELLSSIYKFVRIDKHRATIGLAFS